MLTDAPIVPYIPAADVSRARKVYEGKLGLNPVEGADQLAALVHLHLDHVVARLPELVRLVPGPLVVLFLGRLEGGAIGFLGGDRVVFPLPLDTGAIVVLVAAILDREPEVNGRGAAGADPQH